MKIIIETASNGFIVTTSTSTASTPICLNHVDDLAKVMMDGAQPRSGRQKLSNISKINVEVQLSAVDPHDPQTYT